MNFKDARDQLRGELRAYVDRITTPSKGANMYVCPLCGSGTGKNSTGAFSITPDGISWKCFSCGESGDLFDLIGKHENIPEHSEQVKRAGELFGVNITEYQSQPKSEQYTHTHTHTHIHTTERETMPENYTDFFLEAHKHITETDYPQRRGLSADIINRFNLGYVAEWRSPKAPNAPASPRLIIPTSDESYLARDTRAELTDEQKEYSKMKVGKMHFLNVEALRNSKKPIIIVEGEIDALSIIEAGGEAVALGSTTRIRAFIELLKTEKPSQPLIIAMDNDKAGQEAGGKLAQGLAELKLPYYQINLNGKYKDANEALIKGKEEFIEAVENAERIEEEAEQARREAYIKTSTAYSLNDFMRGIADSVNTPYISTGFKKLDDTLDGGLYEGLYIVGAISSLGKTSLLTQIADQIAQTGQDVLIFSLEMARNEIIAKSISRHTLQIALRDHIDLSNAKTTRGITTGKKYLHYSDTEKALISRAMTAYSEYAEHLYISEGMGDIGVEQIRDTVKRHIYYTGKTPVVIIDYLQILAPADIRATDKQNTDKAVLELKRISRDYKTPVIGISSFNRANYNEAVAMEAFKESGAIEYSSDVLIGLQFKRGDKPKDFNVNEAKRKDPREVELVILKNRNGRTGDTLDYKYYAKFNCFIEA